MLTMKKKMHVLMPCVMALVIALSLFAVPSIAAAETTAWIGDESVDIYATGHLGSPTVGTVAAHTRVTVVSYDDNWTEIRLIDGDVERSGYVITSLLEFDDPQKPLPTKKPEATDEPEATSQKVDTEGANATIATDNGGPLHLRKEASTDARLVSSYANGSRVKVISTNGEWDYVQVDNKSGYMVSEYIDLDAKALIFGMHAYSGVVATADMDQVVRFRQQPNQESEILGLYQTGTHVEVLVMGTEWNRVRLDDKVGYMMSSYVQVMTPNAVPQMTVEGKSGEQVTITNSPIDNGVVATLDSGTRVTVLIPSEEWTEVQFATEDGEITGFIRNEFLRPVTATDSEYMEVG